MVDSAEPMQNVKKITDTLRSPHRRHWKEAIYYHYNKNANVALCSIPFPEKALLSHAKIYKPILAPSMKRKDYMPNYYDLRILLCQNGNEDSINKVDNSHSPTFLANSMVFNLAASACFALWN